MYTVISVITLSVFAIFVIRLYRTIHALSELLEQHTKSIHALQLDLQDVDIRIVTVETRTIERELRLAEQMQKEIDTAALTAAIVNEKRKLNKEKTAKKKVSKSSKRRKRSQYDRPPGKSNF